MRGGGTLAALPDWLPQALEHGFKQEVDASNVMRLTHSANGSPARGYTIRNEAGMLHVQSNEFAEGADFGFTMRFTGERKPIQAFQEKFKELDAVVAALIAEGAVPNPACVQVVEHTKSPKQRGV